MSKDKEFELEDGVEVVDDMPTEDTTTEDPFASKEETVENKIEEEPEEEKPLPFNKDPKVQKYLEKEINKALSQRGQVEKEFVKETNQNEVDQGEEILTRIIGNDTPEKVSAIREFKSYLESLSEKGKESALEEIQAQTRAELQEEREAEEQLTSAFEDIEDEFGVDITSNAPMARKVRNEFIDFIKRVAPKNENGEVIEYPDFQESFQVFSESRKSEPQRLPSRAKELSSRSMTRSGETSTQPQERINWNTVDKIFEKFN